MYKSRRSLERLFVPSFVSSLPALVVSRSSFVPDPTLDAIV